MLALWVFAGWHYGENRYAIGVAEGVCQGIELAEEDAGVSYRIGYTAGFKEGSDTAKEPCCDLCVVYPDREAVMEFLAGDKTNESDFTRDYVCVDFADDLIENAWAAGFPAWIVVVDWAEDPGSSHTIVAFEICEDDEVTLLYIEPQNDGVVSLEVGQPPIICSGDYCEVFPLTVSKIRVIK